jgi:arylsulfatase A-like enzyme
MSPSPISRREVLRGAALGAAALASGGGKLFAESVQSAPNIVFILADDLGYADVSCYGRPDLHTPNIDSLASRGIRFLQAYANSAVCSATRTALITGRYQDRLDIGLDEPLAGRDTGLPPTHPTLPSLLRKAGYGTTLVGKWHLGLLPKYGPLLSGYEHFYGFRGGAVDYFTHSNDLWDEDVKVEQVGYLTDLLGKHAVDVINGYAKGGKPFLLSLHFNAPHWPWEGPGDEAESRRLAGHRLADFDGGTQETYRRMIEDLDLQVGRVVEALRANGMTDNTIVIFTSDNGGERFADTWPFTGRKIELLEGGCAFRRFFRGLHGLQRARSRTRWRSAWIGCRHSWPRRAQAPIQHTHQTGSICCRCWSRALLRLPASFSGVTKRTPSMRCAMAI